MSDADFLKLQVSSTNRLLDETARDAELVSDLAQTASSYRQDLEADKQVRVNCPGKTLRWSL